MPCLPNWKALVLLGIVLSSYSLLGQQSTAGKLTVSAAVQSSLKLVFTNDANVGTTGFCPLTNAGTSNVGLDFGTASFTGGDNLACILFFQLGGSYLVTSGFDVVVTASNSASANYNLAAKVKNTPPANVSWLINFGALTTAFTTFQNNNAYGQAIREFLSAQVGQTVPAGNLNQEIDFLATAN
ncbi:MAG TPA: hypothetical protein VKZ53_31785 [Candidatus Angelobacter sp.]|nr:hypothetical protein [Candidatus Angelobacter sp.]